MDTTTSALPVLIVGAGPSGLVAALSLLQNGVPIRIIDKRAEPSVGFKGAGMQPRSLELYRLLDIFPDVWQKSFAIPDRKRMDLDSGELADFPIVVPTEQSPSRPYQTARFLDQSHHEGLLRSHLKKFLCGVEFGTALENIEQHDDHAVAHLLTSGGEKLVESFSYVIGADGGKGLTRKLLGLNFHGDTLAERGLFADVHVKSGFSHDMWLMWASRDKSLSLASLCYTGHDDTFAFFLLAKSEDCLPETPEELVKMFYADTGRTDIKFGSFDCFSDWRPNVRMVDTFSKGRVFLVGDSAHIHSPAGGQGMNSSIQDAHNLAWKIALSYRAGAHSSLLSSYDSERRPVITQMLAETTAVLKATTGMAPNSLHRVSYLNMLGVNYRGSSIVLDERNPQIPAEGNNYYDPQDSLLCAGDRGPDATGLTIVGGLKSSMYSDVLGMKEVSLFDLYRGTRHVVVAFDMKDERCQALRAVLNRTFSTVPVMVVNVLRNLGADDESVSGQGADLVVYDSQGYAHAHYAVDGGESADLTFVVRPDGVVGAVVQTGAAGVERYFQSLLGGVRASI